MQFFFVFLAIFLLNLYNFKSQDQQLTAPDYPVEINADSIEVIFELWKKDSTGCLGFRHQHLGTVTNYLVENIHSHEQLIRYLGMPNSKSETDDGYVNYNYDTEVICGEGQHDIYCYLLVAWDSKNPNQFVGIQNCY